VVWFDFAALVGKEIADFADASINSPHRSRTKRTAGETSPGKESSA
jgi:hypothetical protein